MSPDAAKSERARVEQEPCRCVDCSMCGGNGHYWVDSRTGQYVGAGHDNLDDYESCDDCNGSGISETCDRCQLLGEMDAAEEYEGR